MFDRERASAEWVEREMSAILRSYPSYAVERTMPYLLLLFARDVGFDALSDRLQSVVSAILTSAGVTDEMPLEDVDECLRSFVSALGVDVGLVEEVSQVLRLHIEAASQANAEAFSRMSGRVNAQAERAPTDFDQPRDQQWVRNAVKLLRA